MSSAGRSDSYYRKHCLSQQGIVPVQSEIKDRLGSHLARTFFESCLPALKPFLGLQPTLEGPGDDLWVSPSDLLIGKVRLKPPLTAKHIQALTHQGILDIGQVVEDKFNKEHELDKQKALAESEEMLRFIANKEKQEAVATVREEERRRQEEIVAQLKLDFQECLRIDLQRLQEKLEGEKGEAVEAGKKEVEELMQKKLELAVLETVQRLTEQFAQELIKQSMCLHKHFWYHIKQEKEKLKKRVFEEKSQCKDHLNKLRTEMQCENIANVMYVLAKERRRCSCEKQVIEQSFVARLQEIEKELQERGEKLKTTISQLQKLGLEVQAREEAMFEIIKQFQKFIYFVLRAVPTQAEYLLNVEKLMILQLTKTVMETKPTFFQTVADSSVTSATSVSSVEAADGLVATDFHECDNYVKYVPSATTLTSEQDLPAFNYDENLYVREDFRNMMSQGLKISKSNHLWNFGVNDVVEFILPSTSVSPSRVSPTTTCAVHVEHRKGSVDKEHVSVRFTKRSLPCEAFEEEILQAHCYNGEDDPPTSSSSSTSSLTKPIKVVSKLELTKDSLTLLKEKIETERSFSDGKKRMSDVGRRSLKTDSFILSAKRSAESKISGTRQVLQRKKDSKLFLAVDSVQLMKTRDSIKATHSDHEEVCTHIKSNGFVKQRHFINIGVQVQPSPKAVTVSHMEIIPDADVQERKHNLSSVSFTSKAKIIPTIVEDESESIIPLKSNLPLKYISPEEIYYHPSECTVVGDRTSTAHLEHQDEFTAKRVTSFIRIFREDTSLRRLFTEVLNK